MQNTDFRGLSNQQIVFLYLVNQSTVNKYMDIVHRRGYLMPADLPGLGKVNVFKEVSAETVERVRNAPALKEAQDIHDVLHPVVELIKDSSPGEYEDALTIFKHQLELS